MEEQQQMFYIVCYIVILFISGTIFQFFYLLVQDLFNFIVFKSWLLTSIFFFFKFLNVLKEAVSQDILEFFP